MRLANTSEIALKQFDREVLAARSEKRLLIIHAVPDFDGYFATDNVFQLPHERGGIIFASIEDAQSELFGSPIHWNLKDKSKTPVNHFTPK